MAISILEVNYFVFVSLHTSSYQVTLLDSFGLRQLFLLTLPWPFSDLFLSMDVVGLIQLTFDGTLEMEAL